MGLQNLPGHLILGAVILNGSCRFYGGTTGEWRMDYAAYDPKAVPSNDFRNDLLTVDETNAEEFCLAMSSQEVLLADVVRLVKEEHSEGIRVLIDFDRKLFVNGFTESELETSAPRGWTADFDYPMDYLPPQIQQLLKQAAT